MIKAYIFLADGFEDIEALAPIDILRRGGIDITTVSIMGKRHVTSSHNVEFKTDAKIGSINIASDSTIILPGGMPGATNLKNCSKLKKILLTASESKGYIAAICAAPMVLGAHGLLEGYRATCYPGFESYLKDAVCTGEGIVVDRRIVTAKGPGFALDFGFALLNLLADENKVKEVKAGMLIQ